jgi:hypothetical protein
MSVWPSAAFTLNGMGGFQPAASSFEMSAFSRGMTSLPLASRRLTTGGASGLE